MKRLFVKNLKELEKKREARISRYSREDGSAAKVSALGNKRRNRQEVSEKEAQQLRIEQKRAMVSSSAVK